MAAKIASYRWVKAPIGEWLMQGDNRLVHIWPDAKGNWLSMAFPGVKHKPPKDGVSREEMRLAWMDLANPRRR